MKYYKLYDNRQGLKELPSEFLMKNDYSGLGQHTHLVIEPKFSVPKNESIFVFKVVLINGYESNLRDFSFNHLKINDIQEMSLNQFLKLKAFL